MAPIMVSTNPTLIFNSLQKRASNASQTGIVMGVTLGAFSLAIVLLGIIHCYRSHTYQKHQRTMDKRISKGKGKYTELEDSELESELPRQMKQSHGSKQTRDTAGSLRHQTQRTRSALIKKDRNESHRPAENALPDVEESALNRQHQRDCKQAQNRGPPTAERHYKDRSLSKASVTDLPCEHCQQQQNRSQGLNPNTDHVSYDCWDTAPIVEEMPLITRPGAARISPHLRPAGTYDRYVDTTPRRNRSPPLLMLDRSASMLRPRTAGPL